MTQETAQKRSRAIVAAVQRPSVSDADVDASLTELRQLAKTLGFEVVATFTQKRAGFHSGAYFGTGKREELRLLREEQSAKAILIDHDISPSQAFNLEKEVGGEVMDRTTVILEIFHRHASSRFARAQVEIARLGYMGPRLREAAKQAGPKDRARSGTGGAGGGGAHRPAPPRQTCRPPAQPPDGASPTGRARANPPARRRQSPRPGAPGPPR